MPERSLGTVGRVECAVSTTTRPWVDVDGLVVSVGGGLGNLGLAVRQEFPAQAWKQLDFGEITPERPRVIFLSRKTPPAVPSSDTGSDLERLAIVLATPHEGDRHGEVTLDAVRAATTSAVLRAAAEGVVRLGLPLLATGALGLPPDEVAPEAVAAAVTALAQLNGPPSLQRVLFVSDNREAASAIESAWAALSKPQLAGGVSRDLVDPGRSIPASDDDLGVAPYASMLAVAIASRATPLPLSIGVFGEWGSGKSYFMGLMRGRVEALARSDLDAYYRDIVQIGFNAWHYSDGNLWASLGDEIFRQLAGIAAPAQEQRETLQRDLAERMEHRHELTEAVDHARRETARLEETVARAAAERAVRTRDLAFALARSPTLGRQMHGIWTRLGLSAPLEQGTLLVEQMRGLGREADTLRRTPRIRQGRIVAVTAVAVLLLSVLGLAIVPAISQWFTGLASAALVALGTALTAVKRARTALTELTAIATELQANLDHASVHRFEVAEELSALRSAEADQRVAEAQLDEVVSEIGDLGRRLAGLAPGRRLYTFLADRAHGDKYTSGLGLVSTIRKDLTQLTELLEDWRRRGERDEHVPRPVDRIVLYIDDLDRCTPQQVADVLQAVHLLLAFELFVVVVGVDPRWLTRSLSAHYRGLIDNDGLRSSDGAASPADYLEKIFNIPMILPSAVPGAVGALLHRLAAFDDDGAKMDVTGSATGSPDATTQDEPALLGSGPTQIPGTIPAQSVTPTIPPEPLTAAEIDLLCTLEPLIRTPRKAKRLLNVYRMLRSASDLTDASRFLGEGEITGDYVAVGLLLGIMTAAPRLGSALLDAPEDLTGEVRGGLLCRPTSATWSGFVADLEPHRDAKGTRNGVVGTIAPEDVGSWEHLHRCLSDLEAVAIAPPDLTSLAQWAPLARRLSFSSV